MLTTPIRINVRPLSVNAAYSVFKGRKLKTKKYREYEERILVELARQKVKLNLPAKGQLFFNMTIGVASRFDIDNAVKCLVDILQKKFDFNDNRITVMHLEKEVVKKGEEYISFQLGPRRIEWNEEKLEGLPNPASPEQVRECIK